MKVLRLCLNLWLCLSVRILFKFTNCERVQAHDHFGGYIVPLRSIEILLTTKKFSKIFKICSEIHQKTSRLSSPKKGGGGPVQNEKCTRHHVLGLGRPRPWYLVPNIPRPCRHAWGPRSDQVHRRGPGSTYFGPGGPDPHSFFILYMTSGSKICWTWAPAPSKFFHFDYFLDERPFSFRTAPFWDSLLTKLTFFLRW